MHLDVENMQDQNSIQSEGSNTVKPLKEIGRLIKDAREEKTLSIEDLAGTIHAHPTMGETIAEGALGLSGEPLHLSGS